MSDIQVLIVFVVSIAVVLVGWLSLRTAQRSERSDDWGRAQGSLLVLAGTGGIVTAIVIALGR